MTDVASVKIGGTVRTASSKCTTHQKGEPFEKGQRIVLPSSVRSVGTGASAILIEPVGELGNGDRVWLADPIRGTVFQLKVCEKDIIEAEVDAIANRSKKAKEAAIHVARSAELTVKYAALKKKENETLDKERQKEIEKAAEQLIMKRAKADAKKQESDDARAAGARHLELDD